MAVQPGDVLADKYRIDALIGRGGMGHVFAATLLEPPGTPVAIKVVSRAGFDETLMARLRREAEVAARIRSEYVPRVLEVSETADGEVFLVMERLVGQSLSYRVRDKGPLPWREVARIGEDLLRGLIDAHTAGVVHRDIKPSNVFLAWKGESQRAMVLDFGVCKTDTVDAEHLTATGESIGTVAYMAPEQIRGASKVDDRADLYGFGVLVFEMLCGKLPHEGPSQMAILASKLERDAARLEQHARVPVPPGLDALVAKALARAPSARFASAQDMLKAWRKLAAVEVASATEDAPVSARLRAGHGASVDHEAPTAAEGIASEAYPTQVALTQGIALHKSGSGRLVLGLAGVALVAGVGSVVAFFARGPDAVGVRAVVVADAGAGAGAGAETGAAEGIEAGAAGRSVADSGTGTGTGTGTRESRAEIDSGGVSTARSAPVVRAAASLAAPKSSAPHITLQPRY